MPSDNVIDLHHYRLQTIQRAGHPQRPHLGLPILLSSDAASEPMSGDVAILAGIIIRLAKTNGRDYDKLPTFVRSALDDHCAEGNSTCRLIRSWLLDVPLADQPPVDTKSTAGLMDRVFRHNRFWSPDSPWLHQANERRRAKLSALLADMEAGE